MSAIVIRSVPAKAGQFAYEVDFYKHGKRGDADPTETRRTENHANKASAYREALLIQKEMRAEK